MFIYLYMPYYVIPLRWTVCTRYHCKISTRHINVSLKNHSRKFTRKVRDNIKFLIRRRILEEGFFIRKGECHSFVHNCKRKRRRREKREEKEESLRQKVKGPLKEWKEKRFDIKLNNSFTSYHCEI